MYLGWCLKEPFGWMPPIHLADEEAVWRYCMLQGRWMDEVRITDLDEACVAHVKNRKVVLPGVEQGMTAESLETMNAHLRKGMLAEHTYIIGTDDNGSQWIQCNQCNMKSYNSNDIEHKYCGFCHDFHDHIAFMRRIQAIEGEEDE